MTKRPGSESRARIWTYEGDVVFERSDLLATEEPLEIRLQEGAEARSLAVTMRTPGADFELVAGFLLTEGAIRSPDDIVKMAYCVDRGAGEQLYNVVTVQLRGAMSEVTPLQRHFFTSSACGVCGKSNLEALRLMAAPVATGEPVAAEVLYGLAETLIDSQGVFRRTGGLHAAALFDSQGRILVAREDVGRHNAVDKVLGWALREGRVPLDDHVLFVSGRASFEIMQKALVARVPTVCAVSAPSSLAVSLAQRFDMTLVGFLRDGHFNVYAGDRRLKVTA